MKPADIIRIARRKRLSGVAITDHNTIKGVLEAQNQSIKDFFIICGAEIETEQGDILGLFLTEEIQSRKALDVIDEIKKHNYQKICCLCKYNIFIHNSS
jgi:predicted metal-dependent phosphoesterase TrpH